MTGELAGVDVQLLEQLALSDPRQPACLTKSTWELAHGVKLTSCAGLERLRTLADRGLVRVAFWRGQERWWTLTERGSEALETASLLHSYREELQMGGGFRGKRR